MSEQHERSPALDDEAGLRAAYAAHGSELYRMAHRALEDDGLAEEAVQETFLRSWRASDRYDPELSSLRTWLFAIARNVVIDVARSRSSRPRASESEAEHPEDTSKHAAHDPIEGALRSWGVEEGLKRISEEHRKAIVETYYHGRTCAEVAAEAGVPEGTMRSRLFYGLKSLRLSLEEMGWEE
jgi:RNA polymerase sigma-70 factor (ECF subfamily)